MKPNLDIRWNGTTFRTNSLGFRTPEVSLEKPAGTYRILVFGSSNTMGYGVNDDEVYTRHLERWLNAWIGPERRVEVVNLAVAGDSPTRRLARLKKEAGRWNADWLLCDASALDSWLEDTHIHTVLQHGIPIPFPFVQEAIRRSGVTAADSLDSFRDKFRGESEAIARRGLRGLERGSRAAAVPLTVVILPRADSKAKVDPRFPVDPLALPARTGSTIFDISTAFDQHGSRRVPHLRLGQASQRRGHQAIFEALRDAIAAPGQGCRASLADDADRERAGFPMAGIMHAWRIGCRNP